MIMKHFNFIALALAFAMLLCGPSACSQTQPTFVPGQSGTPGSGGAGKPDTTPKKYIALTFDDGPHFTTGATSPYSPAKSTSMAVLDKLEKYGVPATFFLIGKKIDANKDNAKKVVDRGLSLGCEYQNHSYNHIRMGNASSPAMTAAEMQEEINKTNALIKELTGVTPTFFRPPFLDRNTLMHNSIPLTFISGHGTSDSKAETTTEMRIEYATKNRQDGDIILMHDFGNNYQTVDALDTIIPELKKQGFTFVTISKLFKLREDGMPAANNGKIYKNAFTE